MYLDGDPDDAALLLQEAIAGCTTVDLQRSSRWVAPFAVWRTVRSSPTITPA